ncbi:hypothetical protein BS50DRAFT_592324 [Corynespora cassiicola Philippines]|uniref:Uncharacterized protein n=1 Tax=Corynespora cassiicola Philippines TaxID=1448308 RepID=A0A2T2N9I5_CORCC|nr:hypothetical protein BS50DRAFT_592324 [Corynespora cassiicola Philippines]
MIQDNSLVYEPTPDKVRFTTNGWKWKPTGAPPTRDSNGTLHFEDFPEFTPNKTPAEIIREGAYGGGYFWPFRSRKLNLVGNPPDDEWVELPTEWLDGLDHSVYLTGEKHIGYAACINKFRVSCEQSIDEWLAAGK